MDEKVERMNGIGKQTKEREGVEGGREKVQMMDV